MARFYPGFTRAVVAKMDADEFEMYWQGITIIEAQEALVSMNIAVYPNMTKQDAKSFHRRMHAAAYQPAETKKLTTADLAERLRRSMSGV